VSIASEGEDQQRQPVAGEAIEEELRVAVEQGMAPAPDQE
jgi:hypothetical protein